MSTIDRQRIAAVATLEALGYVWSDNDWQRPSEAPGLRTPTFLATADAWHDELSGQCEDLAGCRADSPEAAELERITALLQAYETARPRD